MMAIGFVTITRLGWQPGGEASFPVTAWPRLRLPLAATVAVLLLVVSGLMAVCPTSRTKTYRELREVDFTDRNFGC